MATRIVREFLLFATVFHLLYLSVYASVIAKSTISQCIAHGDTADELKNSVGAPCKKKLVVAMTVTENEGSTQKIEANIAKVTDNSEIDIKNVQLQNPIRIVIKRSPVLINYRLFQVGVVANYPHEKGSLPAHCRDDWYGPIHQFPCYRPGFVKNFDAQGKCCICQNNWSTRGRHVACLGRYNQAMGHCMEFDEYKWYVFGLYPPQLQFTITAVVQQFSYTTHNGEKVWEEVSRVEVSPQRRVAMSSEHMIQAEYIADFNPSTFVRAAALHNRYLLVPKNNYRNTLSPPNVHSLQTSATRTRFIKSLQTVSEWLAVPTTLVDLTGKSCDKIGVGYSAFRHQPKICSRSWGSCLKNQPYTLWKDDLAHKARGEPGNYMLYNFGKVHSAPHTSGLTDYQINFIATHTAKSLITISMVADDITIVEHRSAGRIVESYMESFESLAETGTLVVLIQNIGTFTAVFHVYVQHCSAGIDTVPALSLTLNPNQISNVSFVIHSYHAVGKINTCALELSGASGEMLDNMTVNFETTDTCFCYGYCGCACGDENTTCPETSNVVNDTAFIQDPFHLPDWLVKIGQILQILGPTILFSIWIYYILSCLVGLKLLHMIITGEVKIPEPVTITMAVVMELLKKVFQEWFPKAFQACSTCCDKCVSCCMGCTACLLTCGRSKKEEVWVRKVGYGWRIPRNCNGMCKGAKFARRKHRKLMRINKRKGMKNETPWYQKPYRCTCKVKDNMPCLEIFKGLFFFHYCLLLPLIWALHYLWVLVRRKWKRHKRKKRFRATRDAGTKAEDQAYLQLDKYSRGRIEREILDLSKDVKEERRERAKAEHEGFNPEDAVELLDPVSEGATNSASSDEEADKVYASSELQSSDTSDPDEAVDLDELLSPGDPVFFNYPIAKNIPPSLQNPGKMLSIRGRLRTSEKKYNYFTFDLFKYTYQVKEVIDGKLCLLDPPQLLTNLKEFEHSLDKNQAIKLVTLVPLFPCLNDTTTFVMKLQKRTKTPS